MAAYPETAEQKAARLAREANETPEQKRVRLANEGNLPNPNETTEQKRVRLAREANETPEQKKARLGRGNNETTRQGRFKEQGGGANERPEETKARLDQLAIDRNVPDSTRIKEDAIARGESYAKGERLRAEAMKNGELNSALDGNNAEKNVAAEKEARGKAIQHESIEHRKARLAQYPGQIVPTYPNLQSFPGSNPEELSDELSFDDPNENAEQRTLRLQGEDDGSAGSYGHDGQRIRGSADVNKDKRNYNDGRTDRLANETPEQRDTRQVDEDNYSNETSEQRRVRLNKENRNEG